jgi:hypothetical protein
MSRSSRIKTGKDAPSSTYNAEAEEEETDTMPAGLIKRAKSKRKSTKPIALPSYSATMEPSRCSHQYLGSPEKNAIESWNDTVPHKSSRSNAPPDEQDPVIRAYLEAKLSLFRNAGVTGNLYSRKQDAASISSTQS